MRPLPGKDGASQKPTIRRRMKSTTTAVVAVNKWTPPCIMVNSDQVKMLKA